MARSPAGSPLPSVRLALLAAALVAGAACGGEHMVNEYEQDDGPADPGPLTWRFVEVASGSGQLRFTIRGGETPTASGTLTITF